jgi:hypothetical protein
MDSGMTYLSVNRAAHFKMSQHGWRLATRPQKKFKLYCPNSMFVNFKYGAEGNVCPFITTGCYTSHTSM